MVYSLFPVLFTNKVVDLKPAKKQTNNNKTTHQNPKETNQANKTHQKTFKKTQQNKAQTPFFKLQCHLINYANLIANGRWVSCALVLLRYGGFSLPVCGVSCLYPVDNYPSKNSNHINIFDTLYCFHSVIMLLTNVVIKYQKVDFRGNFYFEWSDT